MNDDRRIITPGEFRNRQQQRAGLVELNKRLVREVGRQREVIREQAGNIKAMNMFLTDIATILGTPVPERAEEGKNAIDALRDRVKALVEMGKRAEPDLK